MADLITADQLEHYMGRELNLDTAILLCGGVSAAIRDYCRWSITLEEEVQTYLRGNDTQVLMLPTLKLNAIPYEIWEADYIDSGADEVEVTDYAMHTDGYLYRESLWGLGKEYDITFTHGYEDVPEGVQLAALSYAARLYDNPNGRLAAATGSVNRRFGPQELERALLNPYRLP